MSSFWDEQNLIHCAGPPGVPLGGAGDGFQPNCWGGAMDSTNLPNARFPHIAVGLDDLSFEFWFKTDNVGSADLTADIMNIGFLYDPVLAQWRGPGTFQLYPNSAVFRVIFYALPTNIIADLTPSVSGWRHHAINCDRDGNMTYYVDGILADTVAIAGSAAVNLGSPPFAPFIGMALDNHTGWDDWHENDLTDWDWTHANGIMGPIAVHIGSFLSVAQIQTSIERRFVNLKATTQLLYDWREPEGVTGWDGDRTHIIRGITDYKGEPLAAPEGADGTVIVPDLSGNGNDWTLQTRAVYSTVMPTGVDWNNWTIPGRANCAFVSDPFFQHGGLL